MKKLFGKVNNRRGFTFVEMLVCMLVLLLVTGIITLTVQLSVKYYRISVRESEAQVLCTALATAVKEELEYASGIQGSEADYTYFSRARAHGAGCTIDLDELSHVGVKRDEVVYPLVGSETYSFGLTAGTAVSWKVPQESGEDKYFQVYIGIYGDEDTARTVPLSEISFRVYPINQGN